MNYPKLINVVSGGTKMRPIVCGILCLCVLASGIQAEAATWHLRAILNGKAELPANSSAGHGEANFTYDSDTHQLFYSLTYEGVAGVRADIHGPAEPYGERVISQFIDADPPSSGTITFSEEDARHLINGDDYIDVHSARYPDGEIRGQIFKQNN